MNPLDNVNQVGTCLIWQGATYSNGYGKIYREGKRKKNGKRRRRTFLAHRVVYQQYFGRIPPETLIVHSRFCSGDERCIHPLHLHKEKQPTKMREWKARKRRD